MRLIAMAALLVVGSSAAAQPPKAAAVKQPQPNQPANPPAPIVLASAEAVRAPAADPSISAEAPKRRVTPRVTSCRCGDPQVDPQTQEQ